MILSHFEDLRRDKAYKEKRSLSLRTIAAETGLAVGTVQRINKGQMQRVYLDTLDTLCAYFGVKEIGELIQYTPDAAPNATGGAASNGMLHYTVVTRPSPGAGNGEDSE